MNKDNVKIINFVIKYLVLNIEKKDYEKIREGIDTIIECLEATSYLDNSTRQVLQDISKNIETYIFFSNQEDGENLLKEKIKNKIILNDNYNNDNYFEYMPSCSDIVLKKAYRIACTSPSCDRSSRSSCGGGSRSRC